MQLTPTNLNPAVHECFNELTVERQNTSSLQNDQQTGPAAESGFHATLHQMVQDIDALQKQVDQSIHELTSPEQYSIDMKMQTADSTYDMMMGVKSRLINAYRAIAP